MRFLAMNLLEQNDITTEELGGPLERSFRLPGPVPRPLLRGRAEYAGLEASLLPLAALPRLP